MNTVRLLVVSMALASVPAAFAQLWEFGGGVGGGFYTGKDITSPDGTANAKIKMGLAASAWAGQSGKGHLGGELRYDYSRANLGLTGNSQEATFASESHAMHYDLLW